MMDQKQKEIESINTEYKQYKNKYMLAIKQTNIDSNLYKEEELNQQVWKLFYWL